MPATLLGIALAGANLAGCGEKPQELVPQGEQSYNNESGENHLRERTLNQSESGRISY